MAVYGRRSHPSALNRDRDRRTISAWFLLIIGIALHFRFLPQCSGYRSDNFLYIIVEPTEFLMLACFLIVDSVVAGCIR